MVVFAMPERAATGLHLRQVRPGRCRVDRSAVPGCPGSAGTHLSRNSSYIDTSPETISSFFLVKTGGSLAAGTHQRASTPPASTSAYVTPSGSFAAMCTVSTMSRTVARSRCGSDNRSRIAAQNFEKSLDSLLVMGSPFGSAPALVADVENGCARGTQWY